MATKSEATKRERYYILLYRSNEPEFGYNKSTNFSSAPKAKKYIRCVETGELFESMVAAGEAYGVSSEAIRKAIMKNTRCRNKHWEKVEL